MRAVGADLQGRERQAEIVDRARRACQVVHDVDGLGDLEMLRDVVVQEHEALAPEMLHVLERAGLEIVDADDPVAVGDEEVGEV